MSHHPPPGARVSARPLSFTVRVATMRDEEAQVRFWTSLSSDSIYRRFFNGNREAFRLLSRDPTRRIVMVAEQGVAIVGLGELLPCDSDPFSAEVAFAVLDGFQGRGIGKRLFRELTEHARARGFAQLTACVLPFNHRMLGVFRHSGLLREERHDFDVWNVTLDVQVPRAA